MLIDKYLFPQYVLPFWPGIYSSESEISGLLLIHIAMTFCILVEVLHCFWHFIREVYGIIIIITATEIVLFSQIEVNYNIGLCISVLRSEVMNTISCYPGWRTDFSCKTKTDPRITPLSFFWSFQPLHWTGKWIHLSLHLAQQVLIWTIYYKN